MPNTVNETAEGNACLPISDWTWLSRFYGRVLEVLFGTLSDLLADLFIEYLVAPSTGETPDAARERLSTDWGTMTITNPDGSEITTMEQWSERINSCHWKPGRSAYSLADFIMNRDGARATGQNIISLVSSGYARYGDA